MRSRFAVPGALAALGTVAALASAAPAPTTAELVGSRLVVAMRGTAPSQELLGRVRRGEVAGVILFAGNVRSAPQLRALTSSLQGAARKAGRAPLLVCVDQEGGTVRRIRWLGPPAAATLGRGTAQQVRAAGRATGQALLRLGVNCDLAPVADVPVRGSFLGTRAFALDATRVGSRAVAFARGLADAGVVAAAKHFPGIGRASANTDLAHVTIAATRTQLERDLAPFRRLVDAEVPLVMLSNASYAALGSSPAAWSPAIATELLRGTLGFAGVTITDSLDAPASARGWPTSRTAVLSARAGVDLLLVTGSEETSSAVFDALLAAPLPRAGLQRSHGRVQALRGGLP